MKVLYGSLSKMAEFKLIPSDRCILLFSFLLLQKLIDLAWFLYESIGLFSSGNCCLFLFWALSPIIKKKFVYIVRINYCKSANGVPRFSVQHIKVRFKRFHITGTSFLIFIFTITTVTIKMFTSRFYAFYFLSCLLCIGLTALCSEWFQFEEWPPIFEIVLCIKR